VRWPDPARPLGSWIYAVAFERFAPPKVASVLFALTHLVVLWAGLGWLHRRRWYWTA
jgi:predicted acyltransferase